MIHRLNTTPVTTPTNHRPRHARPSILARWQARRRVARTHGPLLAYGHLAPHNRADIVWKG